MIGHRMVKHTGVAAGIPDVETVGNEEFRCNNKAFNFPGPVLETGPRQLPSRRPAASTLLHLWGTTLAAFVW